MPKLDYYRKLVDVIRFTQSDLYTNDQHKYGIFIVCAQYLDDKTLDAVSLSSHQLAEMCEYKSDSDTTPLAGDWLEFLNDPHVMKWKQIRINELYAIGATKIAEQIASGKFDSTNQSQVAALLSKLEKEKLDNNGSAIYYQSYLPPLLGPAPNGYDGGVINTDEFET